MTLPTIPLAAGVALLALAIYKYIIYPAFLSPLAKIPNAHWSASISPLWILYNRQQQQDTSVVNACHTRLGPIIRLAPNEISVNSVDGGIRTIYAGGFEKGDWYSNVFSNYGVEPMFAMEAHVPHSKRKRMLSNIYAKSSLQNSAALTKITDIVIKERLRPRLLESAKSGEPVELYDVFSAVTMDYVTGYIFGVRNGSDFLQDYTAGVRLFHEFKARQKYTFWPQELPNVTSWLKRLGLKWLVVPTWVDSANFDIESWVMSMCEKAEKTFKQIEQGDEVPPENTATVYTQLRTTLLKEHNSTDLKPESNDHLRLTIASELLDHTLAGFDTSGITLTWLAWQLSKPENKTWQCRLRNEISTTLQGSLDAKSIDNLPILHAILMESLRLHAAIPGQQPRVTPANSTLGNPERGLVVSNIPAGTRVQAQAYSLHREPSVFSDPEKWDPSRWLAPNLTKEMSRWFWAFGSGGRMCVGSNLAMLDMKAACVGIWGRFETEVENDEGMVPNGGYMAEPLGVGEGGEKGIGGTGIDGDGERRKFLVAKVREIED
ncbi:Cytochrome P450 monooxygenase [Pseudocercospora fuligena]|uniref:Cytochrome P450 monooxygenase n=1 Tax=Pseudocercospora fuligena TaxID=685502 RepID=A0A8H6RDI4_9PEZI|nr:Cytochrome P450 monooxygenase [Pseudocercospora fuligena]